MIIYSVKNCKIKFKIFLIGRMEIFFNKLKKFCLVLIDSDGMLDINICLF